MATGDPDGRIAQAVSDRLICLRIEIREYLDEGREELRAELEKLRPPRRADPKDDQ